MNFTKFYEIGTSRSIALPGQSVT